MKKILIVLPLLLLTACDEPIPQDQWKQGEVNMERVAGFEDCIYTVFKTNTGGAPIRAIRCPNSSTSVNYDVPHGKTRTRMSVNTIDATERDVKAEKIAAAEKAIREAQAKLDALKAE